MAEYTEINALGRRIASIREFFQRSSPRFVWYRFLWNWVAKHDTVLSFPLHLDIELTEACNLKCIMCVHGTTGVPVTGRMDMDFARRMIDQAVKEGCRSVKFNWRGEPALHTGLEELVAYAKARGMLEVQINTNGIPFTEARIEALVDAGLDRVIFSMDGATKETYERIRVGADFDKLMRNIRLFKDIRERKKSSIPFIRIQMVRMKDNRDEVDAFLAFAKTIADDIAVKDVTDRGQGNVLFTGEQVAIGRRRCNQPWQRMVVARDGKVYPCCSDWDATYQIGDANTMPLRSIWHGERMEALRDINRQGRLDEVDPCRNCFVLSSYEWRPLTEAEKAERSSLENTDAPGRVVRVDQKKDGENA